ncbi:hypothetical protein GP5015_864 [gamma proteobacterium HTCC5015]|nr:hypothetical protein GP5015_864 [gamma proteobacterium HTCC5015]
MNFEFDLYSFGHPSDPTSFVAMREGTSGLILSHSKKELESFINSLTIKPCE